MQLFLSNETRESGSDQQNKISEWLSIGKWFFNTAKSKYMVYKIGNKRLHPLLFTIDGTNIVYEYPHILLYCKSNVYR